MAGECNSDTAEYVIEVEGGSPVLVGDDVSDEGSGDDDDDIVDDDDVGDDDDSVIGDDDALAGTPQAGDDLPCSDTGIVDNWFIPLNYLDEIYIQVDTVAAGTAFDPYFNVTQGSATGPLIDSADDDFPCTYPPPQYTCPEITIDAPATAEFVIQVGQASTNCNGTVGAYDLNISVNGQPALASLYEDNTQP